MASNRPERIYSIYNPDTIKKDDEDNNNHLGGEKLIQKEFLLNNN